MDKIEFYDIQNTREILQYHHGGRVAAIILAHTLNRGMQIALKLKDRERQKSAF
jgi:hypothetical protein